MFVTISVPGREIYCRLLNGSWTGKRIGGNAGWFDLPTPWIRKAETALNAKRR